MRAWCWGFAAVCDGPGGWEGAAVVDGGRLHDADASGWWWWSSSVGGWVSAAEASFVILHADLIVEASNLVLCREASPEMPADDASLVECRTAAAAYLKAAFEHASGSDDD